MCTLYMCVHSCALFVYEKHRKETEEGHRKTLAGRGLLQLSHKYFCQGFLGASLQSLCIKDTVNAASRTVASETPPPSTSALNTGIKKK